MKRNPVRFFLLLFCGLAALGAAVLRFNFSWHWVVCWALAANLLACGFWGWDKFQAVRARWRVPELALHGMALLGATPAAFVSMRLWRHKTMKRHFTVLYVAFLVLQVAAIVIFWMIPGL